MTLRDFIEGCERPKNHCVYIKVKDSDDSVMISADLDYLKELLQADDERMGRKVRKWSPSVFHRYNGAEQPEFTIWLDR